MKKSCLQKICNTRLYTNFCFEWKKDKKKELKEKKKGFDLYFTERRIK